MPWPQPADYNAAIQNLRTSVSDEELRFGEPELNALGLPSPYAGSFADVYKVHCPTTGNTWAVKCFTRESPNLRDRYREISRHLERARLPFMMDFKFVEPGMRIGRTWYPFLKMCWVEGVPLNQFVGQYLTKPKTLKLLLQLWVKMAVRLRSAGIAHADLQHGNVLLVPAGDKGHLTLRLIDYDGMFVPSLQGRQTGELGHPCYQHPQRLEHGTYCADVDRFSHLAIYTAVHCLTVGGQDLWHRFNNSDNLLFREADFKCPAESPLFQELWQIREEEARTLVGRLVLACGQRLEDVPWLDEVLNNGPRAALGFEEQRHVATLMSSRAGLSRQRRLSQSAEFQGTVPKSKVSTAVSKLAGNASAQAKVQAPSPGEILATVMEQACGPKSVATSPDGRKLAAGRRDGTVRLFGAGNGQVLHTFCGHGAAVNAVAFAPDGRCLASASSDRTVRLWDLRTGREIVELAGHSGNVWSIAFRPDGQRIASGAQDGTIRIWSVTDRTEIRVLSGHAGEVHCVAFSPDGRRIASGSSDKSVRIWNADTGKELHKICGCLREVCSVVFTPDGTWLASGAVDGTVKVFSVETGE